MLAPTFARNRPRGAVDRNTACAGRLTFVCLCLFFFFFSSRRRHTRCLSDWSSDVCSSDLPETPAAPRVRPGRGDAGGRRGRALSRRLRVRRRRARALRAIHPGVDGSGGGPGGAKTTMELPVITLTINGGRHTVDAPPDMPLLWVLRDLLGLTGTKFGCGAALCGACTVNLDGIPRRSCVTPVSAAVGHAITTIEGIGATSVGKRVQQAWLDLEVVQCGYCQSGQIMAATALLAKNPSPTDTDIDQAMSGNICRCGTYTRIRAAIKHATGGKP